MKNKEATRYFSDKQEKEVAKQKKVIVFLSIKIGLKRMS